MEAKVAALQAINNALQKENAQLQREVAAAPVNDAGEPIYFHPPYLCSMPCMSLALILAVGTNAVAPHQMRCLLH